MSLDSFEIVMGKGFPPSEVELQVLQLDSQDQANNAKLPDGFKQGDVFIGHKIQNISVWFQFRSGRLINFNPDNYSVLF
jgi:hypothetical protein